MKVDFFIVGQAKSGTTAMADFLDQHPEICISNPKEPGYFATDILRESDAFHGRPTYFKTRTAVQYEQAFQHAEPWQLRGEASTSYIFSKEAAGNIHLHNKDARIIVLLRHPAEFLHALHMQYVNETTEHENNFIKALELEPQRKLGQALSKRVKAPSLHLYSERIKYASQLKRYLDLFTRERVLVIPYEDFHLDNAHVYGKVLKFLGVKNPNFMADFSMLNASKKPRSKVVNYLVHFPAFKSFLVRLLGLQTYMRVRNRTRNIFLKKSEREALPGSERQRIMEMARPEAAELDALLGSDYVNRWWPGS